MRTLKINHITEAHTCCLCRAAPRLCDFPPCRELAYRARFVAENEAQYGDDAS